MTSLELSKKISQTERTVRYRIKKLEEQKIILGYRPFLNTSVLGLRFYKLLINLKNAGAEELKKIRNFIIQNPDVAYSSEALAGYDFEFEVNLRDSEQLFRLMTEIKEKFPDFIKNIEYLEYIKEHKMQYYPDLLR